MNYLNQQYTPYQHQQETIDFLAKVPEACVASSPGVGKTFIMIHDIVRRKNANPKTKTLVIAPKSLLIPVWQGDILKFAPMLTSVSAMAPAKKRLAAFNTDVDIYITNTDAVKWLANQIKNDLSFFDDFETIIVDESIFFVNDSQRTRALMKLRPHFKYARILNGTLTGGPLSNLYWQYFFLSGRRDVGPSFAKFRNKTMMGYAKPGGPQQFLEWKNKPGMEKVVAKMLSHMTIRHDLTDVVDMPSRMEFTYSFDLIPKVKKAYNEMKNYARTQLEDQTTPMTAINASALNQSLMQISCLTGDTEVLTKVGWKRLINLSSNDLLWDGDNWINYHSLLDNGLKKVVNCWGIKMTSDHKILTQKGWKTAQDIIDDKNQEYTPSQIRLPDGYREDRRSYKPKIHGTSMGLSMYMWKPITTHSILFEQLLSSKQKLWMQTRFSSYFPWTLQTRKRASPLSEMDKNTPKMHKPGQQRLSQLRWPWNNLKQIMGKFPVLCKRHVSHIQTWIDPRQNRQLKRLFPTKLQMVHTARTIEQHTNECICEYTMWEDDSSKCGQKVQNTSITNICKATCKMARRETTDTSSEIERVYDIVNAGPKNRFLIRNKQGKKFFSHNCGSIKDKITNEPVLVDSQRFDLVVDLVQQYKDRKPVVFFNYKTQRVYMMEFAEKAGLRCAFIDGSVSTVNRGKIVQQFQAGKLDCLFLNPLAASHGLTLTESSVSIWSVPIYRGDVFIQANHRNFRIGQNKRVLTIYLEANHTVEKGIYRKLNNKVGSIHLLNDAIKM